MPGNDLNIKVDATTTGYERAIERAQGATLRYDLSLKRLEADMMALEKELDDKVNGALARQHDAMDKTGKAGMLFGGAIVAGFAMATNEAVKWESAWTGVTKTVNGSAAEMDVLEGQLRDLAKTLPSSHEEIAAVAEAAGQLGVQRENVAAFTKVMIDLGQTTNLAAEDAATAIAQMMNVMRTAPDKVDEIGSTLVALGNAGASTESDIMRLAQRLTGTGQLIGASEADVLGLASAMANLGIQAELGGGAMSRVLLRLYQTVKSGGDGLERLAEVAGMTGAQFAQAFGSDPARALDAFFQGLGRVKDSGQDVIGTLSALGISGTQNLQVVLRLAGAGDMLTESLDLSAKAWDQNNALLKEAEKRYGTTESKVAIARNTLRDAAIDVGNGLLPVLATLGDTVAGLVRTWQDLPGPVKQTIIVLGGLTGVVALFGGALMVAVPKVAAFKTAVNELEAGALKTAGTKLMGLLGVLGGPWGIALAAGTTALGIFAAKHGEAAREVDALRSSLDEQTGAITENTRQWVVKKLLDEGVLSDARDLGLNLQTVTDAALGQTDAMAQLNTQLAELRVAGAGDNATATNLNNLGKVVSTVAGQVTDAKGAFVLTHDALGNVGTAAKGAADAQSGTTQAWQDGADAAGSLNQEVKTLGQELQDLSGAYLSQREAGRAVRGQLRDIRKAVADYRKEHDGLNGAFKDGTKSGDDFAGMLDTLAKDYQDQLDAVEKVSGSEKRVQAVYDDSRKKLIAVAIQLGMTKAEAKAYADQVLGIPSDVKTHFEAEAGQALGTIASVKAQLANLDGQVANTFIRTQHYDFYTSGGPPNRSPGRPQANGGVVQAYAGGGFAADGTYVKRVPQIAHGRDIRWAEPETGWEAYISGKPGMEDRNRQVWVEAGRRLGFGAQLQQMFAGGRSFAHGGTTARAAAQATAAAGALPRRVQLVVGDRSFDAYVRDVAGDEFASRDSYRHTTGGRR